MLKSKKAQQYLAVNFNTMEITESHYTEREAAAEAVKAEWAEFSVAVVVSAYRLTPPDPKLENYKREAK